MQDLPNTEAEAIRAAAGGCLFILTLVVCWALVLFAVYRLVLALYGVGLVLVMVAALIGVGGCVLFGGWRWCRKGSRGEL